MKTEILYNPPAIIEEAHTQGEVFRQEEATEITFSILGFIAVTLRDSLHAIRDARRAARKEAPHLLPPL